MRLQLRSSLVKPAKKVIGKQRLTVLVNVSFPAPKFFISNPLLYSDFWLLSPHKILILHQLYFQFVVKLSVVVLS